MSAVLNPVMMRAWGRGAAAARRGEARRGDVAGAGCPGKKLLPASFSRGRRARQARRRTTDACAATKTHTGRHARGG